MAEPDFAADLAALAQREDRPKMARFNDHFADIEAALRAGVSHRQILDLLARHGLILSPATLQTYLQRARRRAQASLRTRPKLTPASTVSSVPAPTTPAAEHLASGPAKTSFEQFPNLPPKTRREQFAAQFDQVDAPGPALQRLIDKQNAKDQT